MIEQYPLVYEVSVPPSTDGDAGKVHTTPENASKMAELAAKSHDGPITLPDVGTDPCQVISPNGPVGGIDGDDVSEKYSLHVGMLFELHVMFVTTWYMPAKR